MAYRPGQLDQKIDFKREVLVDDGLGGSTLTLQDIQLNVWCMESPLSGRESERFDKVNAYGYTKFVTRYRTDILENDRIFYNGVQYNIRYIPTVDTRSMYSEFYAERGVAE